jgi:PAS domain S-box-containing protein
MMDVANAPLPPPGRLSPGTREGRRSKASHLAESENAIGERELVYCDLLNALPAAVYMTDAQGRITFYNEAAVAFSGRRPVLGDQWCVTWRLYASDGTPMPHETCPMAVTLREGREIRGAEAIAERPDGSRVTFQPYPTLLRDASGVVVGAVNMLVDITERKKAEERQRLLSNEVNHRANNLLAVVQSMLRLTQGQSVEAFKRALEGRIEALAHAHVLLAKSRWESADLQHLVAEELAPFIGGETPRVWMSGPPLPLEAAAAQSLAMILHELATNAAKYGALSNEDGRVLIEWRRAKDAALVLRWTELDGPAIIAPSNRGVGSTVIDRSAAHLRGKTSWTWDPSGLAFELSARGEAILSEADA